MSENNQNKPVKLGIIGSGLAVKYLHAPAMKRLKDKFEIVVSCAHSETSAREGARIAAEELNSPNCSWTTDYKTVLANPAVEAVLLSLPINLNAPFMVEAAQAGKHIIAEKPLAADLPQAQKLLADLSQFDNLVIEVAENYHYREDFLKAKEWLAAGRIGDVFLMEIKSRFYIDNSQGFASTPWRYAKEFRGGLVADGGVHYCASLRDLGGEVEHVQAYTKIAHPASTDADTILMNLRYKSGTVANLIFTGAVQTRESIPLAGLIFGTKGTIELTNGRAILTTGAHPNTEVVEDYQVPDFDSGYSGEFENFYQAIRHGAKVVSTVEEAYNDFALIMHALDSADQGGVVIKL